MIARKCDRCGSYFDIPKDGSIIGFKWNSKDPENCIEYDLCTDCLDAMHDFLEISDSVSRKIPYSKPVIGDSIEEVTNAACQNEDTPENSPKVESEEEQVKADQATDAERYVIDKLSGMKPGDIARKYNVAVRRVYNCITYYKNQKPDKYAELEKKYSVKNG